MPENKSGIHSTLQLDRRINSFPMESEFVYDIDYNPDDELFDQQQEAVSQQLEYYHKLAKFVLNSSKTYEQLIVEHPQLKNSFSEQQYNLISEINRAFKILVETDDQAIQESCLSILQNLHDSNLNLGKVSVDYFWESKTLSGNHLFSSTIIELIDQRVQELNRAYSDNHSALQAATAVFYKKIMKIPHFKLINPPKDKDDATKQPTPSTDNILADVQGQVRQLERTSHYGTEAEFAAEKKALAHFIGQIRSLYAHLNTGENNLLHELNEKLKLVVKASNHENLLRYSGKESDLALQQRDAQERQRLIDKGLDKLIVSTNEYTVFLHRTSQDSAKAIMDTGLVTSWKLNSTATSTTTDMDLAFFIFSQRHKQDDAVVILRVPNHLVPVIDDSGTLPIIQTPDQKPVPYIPPSWIVGYISRDSTELTSNTHFGDTNFDLLPKEFGFTTKIA